MPYSIQIINPWCTEFYKENYERKIEKKRKIFFHFLSFLIVQGVEIIVLEDNDLLVQHDRYHSCWFCWCVYVIWYMSVLPIPLGYFTDIRAIANCPSVIDKDVQYMRNYVLLNRSYDHNKKHNKTVCKICSKYDKYFHIQLQIHLCEIKNVSIFI